jgi:hypothetical protein
MKASALAIAVGSIAAGALAQLDSNLNERTNRAYVVISGTKHTTTGNNYFWGPTVPADFSPVLIGGTGNPMGVAAGTHTWRVILGQTDIRRANRDVSGFVYGAAASAASTSFPMNGYQPELEIRKTVLNGAGPGRIPDWTSPAYVTLPTTSASFPAKAWYVFTVTLSTPVSFLGNDLALTIKWQGGEADDKPGTQGYWSDYEAGVMVGAGQAQFGQDYGFASPTNVHTINTNDFSTPKLETLEEEATIIPYSSWGYRNDTLYPLLYGTNIHTINSNLTSVAGYFGWDFEGGPSQAGNYVLTLLNIAPIPFPLSFNLLGQTLELNIGDPAITLGADLGYVLTLNPTGLVSGPKISLPPQPALKGQYVGAEGIVIASTLTQVNETTQAAHWWFQ